MLLLLLLIELLRTIPDRLLNGGRRCSLQLFVTLPVDRRAYANIDRQVLSGMPPVDAAYWRHITVIAAIGYADVS